jgi:hypothetical protein
MAQNFLGCDRDQELWLPPSLREWLPANHLAWFVIDAVESMDLAAFYAVYRTDGHGRPAHEASMVVALLLYCYAIGERSSRRIERRCVEDIAVRVICANRAADHTTIARFRQRHERQLAGPDQPELGERFCLRFTQQPPRKAAVRLPLRWSSEAGSCERQARCPQWPSWCARTWR